MSTIGTYRFHELKLLSFLDTPIRRGIISSGTRSFLTVTETLAGTLGGLKKHLTASNRDSGIENPDTRMPAVRHRSVQHDSEPLKEQSSPLMPTML